MRLLNQIKPQFPKVRTLVRKMYLLIKCVKYLRRINLAIGIADVKSLRQISEKTQSGKFVLESNGRDCIKEEEIIRKFQQAFKALTKKSLVTPIHDCISCQKLCFRRDVTYLEKIRKPLTCAMWKGLTDYLYEYKIKRSSFLCNYCLGIFPVLMNRIYSDPSPSLPTSPASFLTLYSTSTNFSNKSPGYFGNTIEWYS